MLGFIFIFKERKPPKANNPSDFSGVLPGQFPAGLGEQRSKVESAPIKGRESFAINSCKSLMIFLLTRSWDVTPVGLHVCCLLPRFWDCSSSGLEEDGFQGTLQGLSSAQVL